MSTLFEIELDLAAQGSREATRSLYRQLKEAIVDGRLAPGAKLPPTRSAQPVFGVSRNTMAEVYDRLLTDGYLVTRRGAGTFVAETLPAPTVGAEAQAGNGESPYKLNPFWLRPDVTSAIGFWHDSSGFSSTSTAPRIDFRPALVDPRLFPFGVFRKVMAQQLRSLERKLPKSRSPQGNPGNRQLREAISSHVAVTRAVACGPDDVLVTSGAQQAFDLLARALVIPGETVVAVEDPGYPPMRVAFAAAGARLAPVPVDAEGMQVDRIPAEANVICLCPSHQFPLGVTTSARRRKALVGLARHRHAVIVEDDYDGEIRLDGSPLEALRTRDASDVVFYVGTFSKCMLPALRLGFVVAPDWAVPTLVAVKNSLDWHCPTPLQLGVAAFITQGHLGHHVRRMREIHRQRRRHLLNALKRDFARWLEPIPSLYGMQVAAVARGALDVDRVTEALAQSNVHMHSLDRYYLGPQRQRGLIFGLGGVDRAEIDRGLSALREGLEA